MFPPIAAPVLAVLLVAAGGVPTFDVVPNCRAAALRAQPLGDVGICVRKEREARDELARRWAEFAPADKSHCVPLTTTGGKPTYTELLTCLEMSKEARALRAKDRGTVGQGMREKERSTVGQGTR